MRTTAHLFSFPLTCIECSGSVGRVLDFGVDVVLDSPAALWSILQSVQPMKTEIIPDMTGT